MKHYEQPLIDLFYMESTDVFTLSSDLNDPYGDDIFHGI